ncbi:MAG: hypothetical protein HC845_04815 [Akkermansiaceae bacterium]|nr:hypothetical protein [Akkermansiaceae bacterium]
MRNYEITNIERNISQNVFNASVAATLTPDQRDKVYNFYLINQNAEPKDLKGILSERQIQKIINYNINTNLRGNQK